MNLLKREQANWQEKRCLTSPVIREMLIKSGDTVLFTRVTGKNWFDSIKCCSGWRWSCLCKLMCPGGHPLPEHRACRSPTGTAKVCPYQHLQEWLCPSPGEWLGWWSCRGILCSSLKPNQEPHGPVVGKSVRNGLEGNPLASQEYLLWGAHRVKGFMWNLSTVLKETALMYFLCN